ncbi:MAG: GAF domain-containing protein [Elusimicrobia bacterium]|jgi:signal transduction protein with GAF and PtsI domain|nr:GAF domain-containing protein [Elusimicrobiota bacterium]MBK7206893.1 GAF domain-containing protein [Elusimicrobiota bacterium]MBK7545713.1 GAF domain-containing protein [Elusimicrobiota bacterium]MBK7574977.1 GAF domain-containing protein [Elusimicrobiota bacterium]MBK7687757.1 GAF domain-containing protein [Elusimicrobiota bacterium]
MARAKTAVVLDTSEELDLLHKITNIIGSTLELNTMLQEIVGLVSGVTRADACFIYLHEPAQDCLVLSASKTPHPGEIGRIRLRMGEGLTGWVAEHKKPLALPEKAHEDHRFKFFQNLPEDKFESFLSVPILIKDAVVGVINVQHRKAHTHTERTQKLLTTIARQVGGALENARLYEETRRRADAIQTLSAVSHTVASDRYADEILQLIVSMTAGLLKSKICSVMLLDETGAELRIAATQSLSEAYRNKPALLVEKSLSGQAVLQKKPLIVKDVRQDKRFSFRDIAVTEGLVSLLSVPMLYKGKVLGVINTYAAEPYDYTKDDVSILQSVANQCASAIMQTRLLQDKLAAQEQLESRKLVERAKALLMKKRGLSEPDAFREIQKQSMDRRKSMKEIAEALLLAADLG